jgi:MoaA/NifB/PqqE/SkfB family radical SAM enzyme
MTKRYKIRLEFKGAFVFDQVQRFVFPLDEKELSLLLDCQNDPGKIKILPKSLLERQFFNKDGEVNFVIISPIELLNGPFDSDCLSAPNRIYMELTRKCNLRCMLCYNAAGRPLPNEMTIAQIKAMVDVMDKIGVFEARLTGGEPTQREDFLEILDYVLTKSFYVSLATNAIWDKGLTQEICRRKIDDVIVSLEGSQEINDKFRIGGNFRTTLKSIQSLKANGKKVRINSVISCLNWRHVEPLFKLCDKYDLLLIDFIHPRPFGRGETQKAKEMMLSAEETLEFNLLVRDLRKKYPKVNVVMDFDLFREDEISLHPIAPRIKACPAGREFAFVSPQGYVFPCGVAPVHDISAMTNAEKKLFIAGNILEKNLLEIWHQSSIWEAFRDLEKCKPKQCFLCNFWGQKCFGTCPIGAYYYEGILNGRDPYCYAHLLDNVGG